MPCHQHRCCRRPVASDARSLDYVLLAAHEHNVIEGVATVLRGAGASAERHELGLRLNCRGEGGTNWQAALAHLCDTLAAPARRGLRVALVPVGAAGATFHNALLMSMPLDAFARSVNTIKPALTASRAAASDHHFLGDVFKGDALE